MFLVYSISWKKIQFIIQFMFLHSCFILISIPYIHLNTKFMQSFLPHPAKEISLLISNRLGSLWLAELKFCLLYSRKTLCADRMFFICLFGILVHHLHHLVHIDWVLVICVGIIPWTVLLFVYFWALILDLHFLCLVSCWCLVFFVVALILQLHWLVFGYWFHV